MKMTMNDDDENVLFTALHTDAYGIAAFNGLEFYFALFSYITAARATKRKTPVKITLYKKNN